MSNRNKIFLSFLGTGDYKEAFYKGFNEKTRYVQEVLIKGRLKDIKFEKIIFILTQDARRTHWEKKDGLKSRLKSYEEALVEIDYDNNIENLWKLLDKIYKEIPQNAELYMDITHSWRYVPMFLLVAINFLKTTKNIQVKSILYGEFDRDRYKENNDTVFPVHELISLHQLQLWVQATYIFEETGMPKELVEKIDYIKANAFRNKENKLLKNIPDRLGKISSNLNNIVNSIYFVRGKDILENIPKWAKEISESIATIKQDLEQIPDTQKTEILLLMPLLLTLFDRIEAKIGDFIEANNKITVMNAAINWAYKHEMYQQAITLLREAVVTLLMLKGDKQKEIYKREERVKYENVINAINDEKFIVLRSLLKDLNELAEYWRNVGNIRNDMNHAGFNDSPSKTNTLQQKIPELINRFIELTSANS